jgi:hypothetical protein
VRNFRLDWLLLRIRRRWSDFRLISCGLLAHFCGADEKATQSRAGLLRLSADLPAKWGRMLFVQIAGGVFHVADGVVDVALSLVELALRLKFLVISELAGCFLDAAL